MADGKAATKTRYSIVGILVSVWILGILIGWINLTDRDSQTLQLIGITLVVIVGGEFLKASTKRHDATVAQQRLLQESLCEATDQLQQVRDELRALAAEMVRLRKQQAGDAILMEGMVANTPDAQSDPAVADQPQASGQSVNTPLQSATEAASADAGKEALRHCDTIYDHLADLLRQVTDLQGKAEAVRRTFQAQGTDAAVEYEKNVKAAQWLWSHTDEERKQLMEEIRLKALMSGPKQ